MQTQTPVLGGAAVTHSGEVPITSWEEQKLTTATKSNFFHSPYDMTTKLSPLFQSLNTIFLLLFLFLPFLKKKKEKSVPLLLKRNSLSAVQISLTAFENFRPLSCVTQQNCWF